MNPYFEMYPQTLMRVAKYVNLPQIFIRVSTIMAKY